MKNFPHQINQLPRLNAALGVMDRMLSENRNLNDDGILGDALALAGVYTFRHAGTDSVQRLLILEHGKAASNQGTRTCARELRRTFVLLGFLEPDREDPTQQRITPIARALLTFTTAGAEAEASDIWRQAMWALSLTDSSGTSHPYRILLRLVTACGRLPKYLSGLCLEAQDDSEEEFRRILSVALADDAQTRLGRLDSAHMIKNSVKIIPAIAVQLGDVVQSGDHFVPSPAIAGFSPEAARTPAATANIGDALQRPTSSRVRGIGSRIPRTLGNSTSTRVFDPDALAERTNSHEACLDRLMHLVPQMWVPMEGDFDLAFVSETVVLLVEAKTIRADAAIQTRLALGQLLYYEYFDIRRQYPGRIILRLMLTDNPIVAELQEYLASHQTGIIWIPEVGTSGGSGLGLEYLISVLGTLPGSFTR
jgi:hypothetical protein